MNYKGASVAWTTVPRAHPDRWVAPVTGGPDFALALTLTRAAHQFGGALAFFSNVLGAVL